MGDESKKDRGLSALVIIRDIFIGIIIAGFAIVILIGIVIGLQSLIKPVSNFGDPWYYALEPNGIHALGMTSGNQTRFRKYNRNYDDQFYPYWMTGYTQI